MEGFYSQKDGFMYTLAPDEKVTAVMIYTHNSLVRGELVTKESARVSIWLRMQAQVHYIHVHKAQVLMFGGPLTKSLAYDEQYLPISQIMGFHIVPPATEPLDYDPSEPNRAMHDVHLSLGNFSAKGKVRISTHADLATSIEVAHSGWLSVYDAEITTLFVPQFPEFHAPLMLVNPAVVSFAV
jgi:hypothetical protein